jgi:ABC-2 type transport system ATP-binding protein
MLEVRNLCHYYGQTQVLFDLNFSVNQGEIVGMLGPNGAGKSTTMRILTGYLTPNAGQVRFQEQDIRTNIVYLRKQLGYMPENTPLYLELKVAEYLLWASRIKRSKQPAKQTAEVMERCGLKHVAGTLIRHLSKGYQQRVCLAQALLGEPQLLILDEPTVGLDPKQIREIRNLIKELGQEKTILLSTHILPEVELTCDRALIIDRGRIIAEDTPAGLVQAFGGKGRFLLKLDLDDERADEVIKAYSAEPGVQQVERLPESGRGVFSLRSDGGEDRRARLTRLAFEKNWPLLEFKPSAVSLEEVFVSLVREEKTEGVVE